MRHFEKVLLFIIIIYLLFIKIVSTNLSKFQVGRNDDGLKYESDLNAKKQQQSATLRERFSFYYYYQLLICY